MQSELAESNNDSLAENNPFHEEFEQELKSKYGSNSVGDDNLYSEQGDLKIPIYYSSCMNGAKDR